MSCFGMPCFQKEGGDIWTNWTLKDAFFWGENIPTTYIISIYHDGKGIKGKRGLRNKEDDGNEGRGMRTKEMKGEGRGKREGGEGNKKDVFALFVSKISFSKIFGWIRWTRSPALSHRAWSVSAAAPVISHRTHSLSSYIDKHIKFGLELLTAQKNFINTHKSFWHSQMLFEGKHPEYI